MSPGKEVTDRVASRWPGGQPQIDVGLSEPFKVSTRFIQPIEKGETLVDSKPGPLRSIFRELTSLNSPARKPKNMPHGKRTNQVRPVGRYVSQ